MAGSRCSLVGGGAISNVIDLTPAGRPSSSDARLTWKNGPNSRAVDPSDLARANVIEEALLDGLREGTQALVELGASAVLDDVVAERDLPARRLPDLIEAVDLVIDHEVDNVRVYELCRGCVGLVVHRGVAHEVRDPDADSFA
jgi:hypothetical protein